MTVNGTMLCWLTQCGTRHCDGLTRREVLRVGAIGLGGLTLPGLLGLEQAAKARGKDSARPARKAKSVILLFLSGGPSQLDMWDLKPEAPEEIRVTFRPIATASANTCRAVPAWPTSLLSCARCIMPRPTTRRHRTG